LHAENAHVHPDRRTTPRPAAAPHVSFTDWKQGRAESPRTFHGPAHVVSKLQRGYSSSTTF
jgi:hypothetical protein